MEEEGAKIGLNGKEMIFLQGGQIWPSRRKEKKRNFSTQVWPVALEDEPTPNLGRMAVIRGGPQGTFLKGEKGGGPLSCECPILWREGGGMPISTSFQIRNFLIMLAGKEEE